MAQDALEIFRFRDYTPLRTSPRPMQDFAIIGTTTTSDATGCKRHQFGDSFSRPANLLYTTRPTL